MNGVKEAGQVNHIIQWWRWWLRCHERSGCLFLGTCPMWSTMCSMRSICTFSARTSAVAVCEHGMHGEFIFAEIWLKMYSILFICACCGNEEKQSLFGMKKMNFGDSILNSMEQMHFMHKWNDYQVPHILTSAWTSAIAASLLIVVCLCLCFCYYLCLLVSTCQYRFGGLRIPRKNLNSNQFFCRAFNSIPISQ